MSLLAFVITAIGLGSSFADDMRTGEITQEARKKAIANGDRWYYNGKLHPVETATGKEICFRKDFSRDLVNAHDLKGRFLWCETFEENKRKTIQSRKEAAQKGNLFYRTFESDSDENKMDLYQTEMHPGKYFRLIRGNVNRYREVKADGSAVSSGMLLFEDGATFTDASYRERSLENLRQERKANGFALYRIDSCRYKHVDTGEIYIPGMRKLKYGYVKETEINNPDAIVYDNKGREI